MNSNFSLSLSPSISPPLTDDLDKKMSIFVIPNTHKTTHKKTSSLLPNANLFPHSLPEKKTKNWNVKNMLGSAIERKPRVEQVNVTGGRLLREAKVCWQHKKHITNESLYLSFSLSPVLLRKKLTSKVETLNNFDFET